MSVKISVCTIALTNWLWPTGVCTRDGRQATEAWVTPENEKDMVSFVYIEPTV